jgi:hypothetical protein
MLIEGDFRSTNKHTTVVDLTGRRSPRNLAPWGSARALDGRWAIAVSHVVGKGTATIALLDVDTMRGVVLGQADNWFVVPVCNR